MPRSTSSGTRHQETLEPLRRDLNTALRRVLGGMADPARLATTNGRPRAKEFHAAWWKARIARQTGHRRLDRRQRPLRVPLRQAVRGQESRPRCRSVHRGEPVPPPPSRRRRERRADRQGGRAFDRRLRRDAGLRRHHAGEPSHGRRPAGAEERPDRGLLRRPGGRVRTSAPKATTRTGTDPGARAS